MVDVAPLAETCSDNPLLAGCGGATNPTQRPNAGTPTAISRASSTTGSSCTMSNCRAAPMSDPDMYLRVLCDGVATIKSLINPRVERRWSLSYDTNLASVVHA